MDSTSEGFLILKSERVRIRSDSITSVYDVEERPFARGKFATVRRCRHRETGVSYAAKFMRKRRRAVDVRNEILHEVAVLDQCHERTDRIVQLHEVYETASEFALVLELACGGEIQRLIDEDELLDERHVVRFMRQILEALVTLHDMNIAHLDLKPQNVLLTASYPDCDVKLCDFGISRVLRKGVEVRELVGTPDYVAPEILNYEPITLATDMWSVGVLAYVFLSGHSPFGGDNKQETFCNISQVTLDFPDTLFGDISMQAIDFIRKLLAKDSCDRMTARECLQHPWLRSSPESNRSSTPGFQSPSTALSKSPILPYRRSHAICDSDDMTKRLKFSDGLIVEGGVVC